MFIESLEFTIPVDLCSLCTTLQKGALSDLEFPASVNSYGTTQDASIQVALRANKLTFKVDGVSSNASIISKSECKTLKLSVFDVDRSQIPQDNFNSSNVQHHPNTTKRTFDQTSSTSTPVPSKVRKNPHNKKRKKIRSLTCLNSESVSDICTELSGHSNNIFVKTEPDDPDLIEINLDLEQIKTEDTQMQSFNSSHIYPQTSQSSSTYETERNVPHVPDYAEPSTSSQHGNESAEDILVFQDEDYDGEENEADYSNDARKRRSYTAVFKLNTIKFAEENGNRQSALKFRVHESMIRYWRKQKDRLQKTKQTSKSFRGNKAR